MFPALASVLDVFVVDVTGSVALGLVHEIREAGVRADRAIGNRSMKSQFKLADRSGAALAVVIGQDELAAGKAKVQSLRGDAEETVALDDVVEHVRRRLSQ